jgi:hypothetical protein
MSPRLQRRDWLHLQRFAPCEVKGDLPEVSSAALGHESLHLHHSRRFARGLMNSPG